MLEQRIIQYQEEARIAKDALQRSEEAADLLAEKSMIAEQESMLLQQKATEAENEVQRIKLSVIKTEEEKLLIENKAREAEHIVQQLVEVSISNTFFRNVASCVMVPLICNKNMYKMLVEIVTE